MSELKVGILSEKQRKLFEIFKKKKWVRDYYLAGGTGLALMLGHRQSVDFDFFSREPFSNEVLSERLAKIISLHFVAVAIAPASPSLSLRIVQSFFIVKKIYFIV